MIELPSNSNSKWYHDSQKRSSSVIRLMTGFSSGSVRFGLVSLQFKLRLISTTAWKLGVHLHLHPELTQFDAVQSFVQQCAANRRFTTWRNELNWRNILNVLSKNCNIYYLHLTCTSMQILGICMLTFLVNFREMACISDSSRYVQIPVNKRHEKKKQQKLHLH